MRETRIRAAYLLPRDLYRYANGCSRPCRGGLRWYRAQDYLWQGTPFLIGRTMLQPTLYIGGSDDAVVEFARPYADKLEKSVPNLWNKTSAE